MAELRTIEKPFEIGTLSIMGSILSLPDDYVIIPHLLYSATRFNDYVITVVGPNGLFLISYQLFLETDNISDLLEDSIIYLREYAVTLQEYFSFKNIFIPDPHLIIIAEPTYPDMEGDPDDLLVVGAHKLKKVITSTRIEYPVDQETIENLTYMVRANGVFKRINQYQLLMELEYLDNVNTYMAYDTVQDRPVLIKEIKNYLNTFEIEDLEKNEILREAKLTMQLQHVNILNIEQIIPREDSLYVVIEWIEKAVSLREFIDSRNSFLEPEEVKKIILQLCEALEHAHSKGVVHRNIRPENIMITENLTIKLSNFDLAKKLDVATRSTFDLKQMIKDNPYSAPELKLGSEGYHNIDQKVDVYSTGIIFYELLTNRLPSHFDERYWNPPSKFNLNTNNDDYDDITLKAIRFDPHHRFATISAFKNRILKAGEPFDELNPEHRYVDRQIYKRTRNSIIYFATDKKLSRKVALKKILLDKLLTTEQRKQKLNNLLAEANIVSKLLHPNIVSVYDYFIEDEDGYIVMEWLEGRTLRELQLDVGQFEVSTVLDIGIQIAEALKYAHIQNVIHKDIKPENVIFHNGKVTILDFGLAGFLDEGDTKTCGTAMYMSPEQINETTRLDLRSDIFSLGVLLYELLTGKYPFDASVIMSKFAVENIIPPLPPGELAANCPMALNICLGRALKIDPRERYQKINEFIDALKKINSSSEDNLTFSKKKNLFSEIPLSLVTALAIIAFLTFYIMFLTQRNKSEITGIQNIEIVAPNVTESTIIPVTPDPNLFDNIKKEVKPETPDLQKSALPIVKWRTDTDTSEEVIIQAELRVEYDIRKTRIMLNVTNNSDDEMEMLNRTDIPDLLNVSDDLGNDYTSKVDIRTVTSELIRIYPNSSVKGYFEMNEIPHSKASNLVVTLSEYEGKKRKFSLVLNKN